MGVGEGRRRKGRRVKRREREEEAPPGWVRRASASECAGRDASLLLSFSPPHVHALLDPHQATQLRRRRQGRHGRGGGGRPVAHGARAREGEVLSFLFRSRF